MKRPHKHTLLAIAATAIVALSTFAVTPSRTPARNAMKVMVENVDNDNSDGVTRVRCVLLSTPHTSSRIDSVELRRPRHAPFKGLDIDGVDFGRYFQWEDEGVIAVEVDFARQRTALGTGDTLLFHTVHGTVAAPAR